MNATIANLINSISLMVIGLWGYLDVLSPTALIPVSIGVFLILCSRGVKNQNKIISHIAVLLTLLILIALEIVRELPITLILRPFNFETFATTAYISASEDLLEAAAVPSLFLILIASFFIIIASKYILRETNE